MMSRDVSWNNARHQKNILYHASLLWIVFRFFTTIPGGTSGSTKVFSHDARARPKRSGLTRLKELKRNDMVANPMNNRQNAVKQIDSSGHWWCCCVTRWAYLVDFSSLVAALLEVGWVLVCFAWMLSYVLFLRQPEPRKNAEQLYLIEGGENTAKAVETSQIRQEVSKPLGL